MKITNKAYSLITEKLEAIERCAGHGIFKGDPRKSCLEIRNLACELQQVIANNFLVGGNDDLPPAA